MSAAPIFACTQCVAQVRTVADSVTAGNRPALSHPRPPTMNPLRNRLFLRAISVRCPDSPSVSAGTNLLAKSAPD